MTGDPGILVVKSIKNYPKIMTASGTTTTGTRKTTAYASVASDLSVGAEPLPLNGPVNINNNLKGKIRYLSEHAINNRSGWGLEAVLHRTDLIQTICLLAGLVVFAPMIWYASGTVGVWNREKQLKPIWTDRVICMLQVVILPPETIKSNGTIESTGRIKAGEYLPFKWSEQH